MFIDRVVGAVDLLFAHGKVDAGGAGTVDGNLDTGTHALLARLVVAAVLFAGDGEVASDGGVDAVAARLRTGHVEVATDIQVQTVGGGDLRFGMGDAAAVGVAFGLVDVGEYGDAGTAGGGDADLDTDCPAGGFVVAVQLVGVGCGVEVHVAGGGEVDVFAGEVGAGDVEVAVVGKAVCILGAVAGGDEGEVVAGGDVAADRDGLRAVAVGFTFTGADGDGERDDVALLGFGLCGQDNCVDRKAAVVAASKLFFKTAIVHKLEDYYSHKSQ